MQTAFISSISAVCEEKKLPHLPPLRCGLAGNRQRWVREVATGGVGRCQRITLPQFTQWLFHNLNSLSLSQIHLQNELAGFSAWNVALILLSTGLSWEGHWTPAFWW